MKSKILIAICFTLLAPSGHAAKIKQARKVASSPAGCTALEWPFRGAKIQKKDKLTLMAMDRAQVRSFYIYEISSPKMRADLASGLEDFLSSVEPNAEMRAFYELTRTAAELNSAHPQALPRNEVCDLLNHVGNRLPTE